MKESVFLKFDSFKEHEHLCHLYSNDTERLEIGTNFVIHGIKKKEKCLYISDRTLSKEFMERLMGSGVNVDKARREKIFEEIIASGRRIEEIKAPNSFTHFLNEKIEVALKEGKKPVRILMNKNTLLYNHTNLLWREASLDKLYSEKSVIALCQYEIGRVNCEVSINLFKTHPRIILENLLYDSPFYTLPDKVLPTIQEESTRYATLTPVEKKILRHIVEGYSNKSMAKELSISVKTVETHRANIMRKLGIHKLVDLVKFAMRKGII
jgi:DNA-binding CsgD family transcriptional regulator